MSALLTVSDAVGTFGQIHPHKVGARDSQRALTYRQWDALRPGMSWFMPGQAWLHYPSTSNEYWLRAAGLNLPDPLAPDAIPADMAARIADAFGLFGPPARCLEHLLRARELGGMQHVFLLPAHTREGGYDLPVREVETFGRVIRPAIG